MSMMEVSLITVPHTVSRVGVHADTTLWFAKQALQFLQIGVDVDEQDPTRYIPLLQAIWQSPQIVLDDTLQFCSTNWPSEQAPHLG